MTSEDAKYEAVRGRDGRFDGEFFFAVSTTGIYCRPSCPAVTPKRQNVRFYQTAAAAQGAGYRACRRCRPDAVPGSPQWNVRADAVGRAMRLIADGVVDREGVPGLAARLGYSARQVQRQLNAEVGAGPVALARAQRAHTARVLLQTTSLPASEVAFAAGFDSIRQFNDTIRAIYAVTPTQLRTARPKSPGSGSVHEGEGGIPLRLAFRGPYAAAEIFDYLERRAVAGVEELIGKPGARTYRRTLRLPAGPAIAEVDEKPHFSAGPGQGLNQGQSQAQGGWLECRLHLGDLRDLTAGIQRMRRLFDLDADPYAVAETLGTDAIFSPLINQRPGLRVPGAADPEELAVRAVLGQQLPTADGRKLGAALVAAYGELLSAASGGLTHLFPRAADLAANSPDALSALDALGIPESRRATLRALGAALTNGTLRLDPGVDRDQAEKELLALPGIEPWTAGYVRMRALGDPDVLLESDSAISTLTDTHAWQPWRSYAMHYLWTGTTVGESETAAEMLV